MLALEQRTDLLNRASELNERSAFRALIQLLASIDDETLNEEPELLFWLSVALYRTKQYQRSWSVTKTLRDLCRRRGKDKLYRQTINLEGGLLFESGQFSSAADVFRETLALATVAGDHRMVADATLNLGTIAWIHCKWDEALAAFQRSRTAYTMLGNRYTLAACYQNIGMTLREMSFHQDADSYFEQAFAEFSSLGPERELELAAVECERAILRLKSGDIDSAEVMVQHALSQVASISAPRSEGEALLVLGRVFTARGRYHDARSHLREAFRLARVQRAPLTEGEIFEALAAVATCEGDLAEAAQWTARAVRTYEQTGVSERAERLRKT